MSNTQVKADFRSLTKCRTFRACEKIFAASLDQLMHVDLGYHAAFKFYIYEDLADFARPDALWYKSLCKMLVLARAPQEYLAVYWGTKPEWPAGHCNAQTGGSRRLLKIRKKALKDARSCVAKRMSRARSVRSCIRVYDACAHRDIVMSDIALSEVIKPALKRITSFDDMKSFVRHVMYHSNLLEVNFGALQRQLSPQQIEWFRGSLRTNPHRKIKIVGEKVEYTATDT